MPRDSHELAENVRTVARSELKMLDCDHEDLGDVAAVDDDVKALLEESA